ncbi:15066_t:CDS:2 [Gigaspora margarita]|uniref:15066_t:CDS:1 n=1 Tax=Gigaspora margarita TaxID=4874 RepID=A0ABN7UIR7_GIGMA|nr:15066_t:CDS:2 [Gigaspora margarita]
MLFVKLVVSPFAGEHTGQDSSIFALCYQKGAIILEEPLSFPDELKILFKKSYPLSSEFLKHIQNYNAAMAFVSILSNIEIPIDEEDLQAQLEKELQ